MQGEAAAVSEHLPALASQLRDCSQARSRWLLVWDMHGRISAKIYQIGVQIAVLLQKQIRQWLEGGLYCVS